MLFPKSLKIWILTNLSGALVLTTYMAITCSKEGDYLTSIASLLLLFSSFGLLFSIPAIPFIFLTLNLAEDTVHIPQKIIILFLGNAVTVYGVMLLISNLLDIEINSDYGENLLEFTWPQIFTSFISTFYVAGKSIFKSNH